MQKQTQTKRGACSNPQKKLWTVKFNLRPLMPMIVVCSFLSGIYFLCLQLQEVFNLPVESVSIAGTFQQVSKKEVEEIIEPKISGGYLTVDLGKIKADLEALPWVYRATIKRQWPQSIEVWIYEQKPLTHWRERSFLNDKGEVFTPNEEIALSLPRLYGPLGSHLEVLHRYQKVNEQLKPYRMSVDDYQIDKKGAQRIVLNNDIEIRFGSGDIEGKLRRFLKIYRVELANRISDISRIDLRYTNGLAVQWHSALANVSRN